MDNMQKNRTVAIAVSRIALAGAAAILILLIVLYRRGVYDISFLERPADTAGTGGQTADRVTREPQTAEPSSDTAEPAQTDPADTDPAQPAAPDYATVISTLPAVSSVTGAGYGRTGNTFVSGSSILARLDTAETLPSYLYTDADGKNPVLNAYMGHILLTVGERVWLLDGAGNIAMSGLEAYSPAYLRDLSGHPLFTDENGEYFRISDDGRTMIRVLLNPSFAPPVRFDSPVGYGTAKGELHVFARGVEYTRYTDAEGNDMTETMEPYLRLYEDVLEQDRRAHHSRLLERFAKGELTISEFFEQYPYRAISLREAAEKYGIELPDYVEVTDRHYRYGYADANGKPVIEAVFAFACEFSENGLAVVAYDDGVVQVINTAGDVVINPRETVLYLPGRGRRPAYDGYYLPDTFGYENLGMFYFDHGMIRMRRRIVDYYYQDRLVREETVLVREDGSLFDIPDKYTLVGYSDGVLLLERDGRYGYFDISERWICDPTLTEAAPFCEGLAAVRGESGKMGVIDTDGNIVLPEVFDWVQCGSDGVVLAYEQTYGWTVYYKMEISR